MRHIGFWLAAGLALAAPGAQAQLLPSSGAPLGGLGQVVPDTLGRVNGMVEDVAPDGLRPAELARQLVAARTARIADLLRLHGDAVELDDRREPARRGTILLTGADAASIAALRAAGFTPSSEPIEGIDLPVARIELPEGQSLARALKQVRKLAPTAQVSADNLYTPSGAARSAAGAAPLAARPLPPSVKASGLIDGGVASHPSLTGPIEQRGFASGAPRASAHGTAVASLISGTGMLRGAAPGTALLVADVYGDDPAGGSAFAIARAIGWMAARGVTVVTISLVGPDNPLLAGAIRLARDKGVTVVAAVGNDGPAAPPAYPASYREVVAVTGIDGRGRLLPEAGRALHVDFAAPGADMDAAQIGGGKGRVRGTSFATPLVAGRLFASGSLSRLQAEATPPPRDRKASFGKGIICPSCRNIE